MRTTTVLVVRLTLSASLAACGCQRAPSTIATVSSVTPSASASSACGDAAPMDSYQPATAWSGRAANVPDPPTLPTSALRVGSAYTVYGALRALHGIDANIDLQHDIEIVGFIVDTNLARAPKCALHHTGVADPAGCNSEIPTFTIADEPLAADTAPRIRVMGWASNFPNVYEAYLKDRAHNGSARLDEVWAREIPVPLPAVGAKVKVTGRYGALFALSSAGITSDPRNGIMTAKRTEYLAPATTLASFPQLTKR
jgi:hypothetical protein